MLFDDGQISMIDHVCVFCTLRLKFGPKHDRVLKNCIYYALRGLIELIELFRLPYRKCIGLFSVIEYVSPTLSKLMKVPLLYTIFR